MAFWAGEASCERDSIGIGFVFHMLGVILWLETEVAAEAGDVYRCRMQRCSYRLLKDVLLSCCMVLLSKSVFCAYKDTRLPSVTWSLQSSIPSNFQSNLVKPHHVGSCSAFVPPKCVI
jgi:hypothetical protein